MSQDKIQELVDKQIIPQIISKMVVAIRVAQHIRQSVTGSERAVYQAVPSKHDHESLKIVGATAVSKYYTDTYNSIVQRDDPYVTERFDWLHAKSGHSYHCLALKMGHTAVNAALKLDRRKITELSLDEYTLEVERQLQTIINLDRIYQDLHHSCSGPPLSEMKAFGEGELMYTIGVGQKGENVL